jgi:ribose transport system substrate-binding protein
MQRSRLAVAIGALVCATGIAAGCGSDNGGGGSGGGSNDNVALAVFPYAFGNPYAEAQMAAIKATAAKMGASIKMFDSGFDAAKQMNQVQDAVASGRYKGIIIAPDDGSAIAPAIEDAASRQVKVVCIGSPCGSDPTSLEPQVDGQLAYVGVSSGADGPIQAKLFADACKGKTTCKVAYILGLASNTSEAARTAALKEALKQYPNVKLVATAEGKFDKQASFKVAQDLLQAHSDLDAIGSGSDQMTLGAEQAAKEAGRKIALVGNAASAEGVKAVQEKRWVGTSVWLPRTEAEVGTQLLIDAIHGETVAKSVDVRTKSPIGDAVTQDNAAEFTAQWHS